MSELSFDAVSHAQLASVSGVLDAGIHVLLGSERDGTGTVVQLAAGLVQAAAGRVLLDGRRPFSRARVRRTIGALCAEEQLPTARTAAGAVELALRARADSRTGLSVLDAARLTHLAPRRPRALSMREMRAVALAIALSHPQPALLALHEPLALLGALPERFLLDSLTKVAESGAVVLVTVSRVEDISLLGGEVHALERGIWLDSARSRTPLREVTLRVQAAEARRLATRLASLPEVSAITSVGAAELLVHGLDIEQLANSVVRSARGEAIRISALRQDWPELEPLSAARSGITQAFNPASPE